MNLEVHKTLRSTEDSVTILFKTLNGFAGYKAGQHGNFIFDIDGEKFKRSYSFHTVPEIDDHHGITIRTVEDGIVSQQAVKNGFDSVVLESIDGDFFIEPSATRKRQVVMFAGGSGITPLMSMIKSLLTFEHESSISLIYSNQSIGKIIFRKELEDLQREYANRFKIYHVITREENPPEEFPLFFKGRLPKIVVRKLLKTITSDRLDTEYYICGPHDFIKLVQESIASLNTGPVKVFIEHFFVPGSTQDSDFAQLPSRMVTLTTTDGEKSIVVDGGCSILQAALDNDIKVPYSCTQGQCGTCRAELLSGEVKLRKNHALTEQELAAGQILLCQGFPVSDGVTIQTRL